MTEGDKIKALRKEQKITQKALSERTGIAEPTIRKYESNRLKPKYQTLKKFAAALQVPVENLLPDEEEGMSSYALDILEETVNSTNNVNEAIHSMIDQAAKTAEAIANHTAETLHALEKSMQNHLMQSYNGLNMEGRQEAIKRVDELAQLPQYTKSGKTSRWKEKESPQEDHPNPPEGQ